MAFERGSLVLVGYTAKLDDGTVIEVANHDGYVPDEVHNFSSGPKLVSVGDPSYPVLRGFDRALADAELDAPQTVTVQPADAYGERRRDKVKMITARKLGKDADRYTVGDMVEVDNNTGVILSMGSGRVRVDFNHMFAGKSITYEFTVLKQLESDTDKIEALLAQSGMLEDYDPLGPDGDLDDTDVMAPGEGEGRTDEDLDAADDLDDTDGPAEGGGSTDEDLDAALKDVPGDDEPDEDLDNIDEDPDDDLEDLDDLDDDEDLDDGDEPEDAYSEIPGYILVDDTLTVAVPPSLHRDPKLQDIKYLTQMDIFKFVPRLSEVRFLETHHNAAIP